DRIERQLRGVISVLANSNFPLTDRVLRQMRDLSRAEFILANDGNRLLAASDYDLLHAFDQAPPQTARGAVVLGTPLRLGGKSYLHTAAELPPRIGESAGKTLHILFPEAEYRRSWREAVLPPLAIALATAGAVIVVAQLI